MMSAKLPARIVTQFPSYATRAPVLRNDAQALVSTGKESKRNLQYLLLARVRDYHPTDDEVKQGYRINSKSFPVRWLAIPEELYGGCKGNRQKEKLC